MPPSPFSQWWILWVFRSEEPTKLIIIEKFLLHSDELQSNRMLINFSVLIFLFDASTHRLWLSKSPKCAPCFQRMPSERDQMRTKVNRRLRLSDRRIPSAMDRPKVPRDSSSRPTCWLSRLRPLCQHRDSSAYRQTADRTMAQYFAWQTICGG